MTNTTNTPVLSARDEAIVKLRELCPPGTTVYTVLRHVSRSGMSRRISAYVIVPADRSTGTPAYPFYLDGLIVRAGIGRASAKHDGIVMGGTGMDMGFALVYGLSRTIYADGVKCTGSNGYTKSGKRSSVPACRSNDHTNDYGRLSRLWETRFPDRKDEMDRADFQRHEARAHNDEDMFTRAQREFSSLVAERQAWIASQKTYTKTRTHSDGGYALSHTWI